MKKKWPDGDSLFPPWHWWATALGIPIAVMVLIAVLAWPSRQREIAEQNAAWAAWQADLTAKGCKRTGYTSQRSTTYPIWTCPDGTAHKGRGE